MQNSQQIASTTPEAGANREIASGELDLEALNLYLASSCCTLLDVNKDKFYSALHEPSTQEVLAQFAQDKNQRTLLVNRIDHSVKDAHQEEEGGESPKKLQEGNEAAETTPSDEVKFSLKVQYYGSTAHTIAFLKREAFTSLDLRGDETGDHVSKQV